MKELIFRLSSYNGGGLWEAEFECLNDDRYLMEIVGEYWCEIRIYNEGKEIIKIISDYITMKGITENTVGINFGIIQDEEYDYKVILDNDDFVSMEEIDKENNIERRKENENN